MALHRIYKHSLDTKANIASPTFTGTVSAPPKLLTIIQLRIATTGYVQTELNYASDSATFTNKGGAISQWTNDSGYITASSTNTLTNKSGNISQWTNNSNYLTPSVQTPSQINLLMEQVTRLLMFHTLQYPISLTLT